MHLAFGDMGASDAFTLCSTCSGKSNVCDATTCASANQSAGLISEILKSNHLIHTGDFACKIPLLLSVSRRMSPVSERVQLNLSCVYMCSCLHRILRLDSMQAH